MSWLQRVIFRKKMECDLEKELRFHFESQIADKMRSGISESEARRLTRLEFGGIEQIKENCRESHGTLWLESIAQDIRYSLRGLLRNPGFSAAAILSLALGIGATNSMFSLIYAVLLHPVPYADWQRLTYPIYLNDDQPTSPERWFNLAWPQYQQLLKANCVEDALGDDNTTSAIITGRDIPEDVTLT